MSYDIKLIHPVNGDILELDSPHHMKGGTYQVGGTAKAEINITYNYSKFFSELFGEKGIRFIYGMSGSESIEHLEECIPLLKDDLTDNYWDATEGNAKAALCQLLALAKMRPDGVWDGD